jgi:DNA polymerase III gamma/tau subunit
MNDTSLIVKYRPKSFQEVIGNGLVIKSLEDALNSLSRPHTYLFTGPSGTGKTTLARIVATGVSASIEEIDGASNSGVEAMRNLVEMAKFTPIMSTDSKMIIIDECHALSTQAWSPLLKILEEPPNFLYVALATTNPAKIPDAIKTRAFRVDLKPLKANEISDLVSVISELEGWTVTNEVFQAIVTASTGQPRKALTILQSGHGAQTLDELSAIIAEVEKETSELTELCRYLLQGGRDWPRVAGLLSKIDDADGAHDQACNYLVKAMLNGSGEAYARQAWTLLDALTFPRTTWDRKVQLAASIGSIMWAK